MNYLFIILGIVVVIILYFVYSFLFPSKSKVANKNYLAAGVKDVSFEKLENPSSEKYSLEVWIYANNLNDANPSTISSGVFTATGGTANKGCIFEVFTENSTSCYHLDLFKDTTLAFYNTTGTTPIVTVPNFPLQRWVYVVISVDNKLVDIYLDGKLIRSVQNTAATITSPTATSTFKFGKGDIYIAGMNRTATVTDSNTVFKNYMQGNAGLRLPGYSISLDFLKNSSVAKNIPIM